MAKRETIDYTKMAAGTVTMRWEYRKKDGTRGVGEMKTVACPACGRVGEMRCHEAPKTGEIVDRMYVHVVELVQHIPGFPLPIVKDQCTVPEPKGGA